MSRLRNNIKILITRTDRIGDFILSTPVFKALREKFPEAWIAALTFVENRLLLEGNPYVNEVILYDKKGSKRGIWGQLQFAREMASKKVDVVIHLHSTNRMHLMSWMAGIPVRIGWAKKNSWALTQAFPDIKVCGERHEASYNFDLLKPLGVDEPEIFETFMPQNEKWNQSFEELVAHFNIPQDLPWVVLSPSASCPSKKWPADRFARLAEKIHSKHPSIFLVVGTSQDRQLYERMRRLSCVPLWDLTGRIHLGELAVLLKRASLLISNDSGPVHIASAVGTPVISIFGRKQPGLSPKRWGPLGMHSRVAWKDVGCVECLAHNCQINFLCLDALSVNEVYKEMENLVGAGSPRPGEETSPLHK